MCRVESVLKAAGMSLRSPCPREPPTASSIPPRAELLPWLLIKPLLQRPCLPCLCLSPLGFQMPCRDQVPAAGNWMGGRVSQAAGKSSVLLSSVCSDSRFGPVNSHLISIRSPMATATGRLREERGKVRRAKKKRPDVRTQSVSSAPLGYGGICSRPPRGNLGTGHFS